MASFPFTAMPQDVDDLSWRDLSPSELTTVETWLDAAAVMLQATFPDLATRVSAGSLSEAAVRHVQAQMVLRIVKNPDNLRQWSIDDASFTRDNAVSSGLLTIDPTESALLAPRRSRLRFGTIRLGSSL